MAGSCRARAIASTATAGGGKSASPAPTSITSTPCWIRRRLMAGSSAIKRRLIQQGVDVIDVGAGDADFPPPAVAVEAIARALQDPAMSRYAFQLGLPAFREAAAAYLQRRFGFTVDPFKELHPLLGS